MSALLRTHCQSCGATLKLKLHHLSTSIHCPKCGADFVPSRDSRVVSIDADGVSILQSMDTHRDQNTPSAASMATSAPGATIGGFVLKEVIGRGGFGVVYKAFDPNLERDVAVKVPQFHDERQIARFLDEPKAAARLDHPNIVKVFASGRDGDSVFIAYEFVDGRTLDRIAETQTVSPLKAARWVRDAAAGVAYAHSKGVVHRDLKTSNLILGTDGRVRILDFGLAKRTDRPANLTADGSLLGTPYYMSPEQARGDVRAVGPPSDQYSLGVVLFELLAGRRPFEGSSTNVIVGHAHKAPPQVGKFNEALPEALQRICMRMLEKAPADRFASLDEVADLLDGVIRSFPASATEKDASRSKDAIPKPDPTASLKQPGSKGSTESESTRIRTKDASGGDSSMFATQGEFLSVEGEPDLSVSTDSTPATPIVAAGAKPAGSRRSAVFAMLLLGVVAASAIGYWKLMQDDRPRVVAAASSIDTRRPVKTPDFAYPKSAPPAVPKGEDAPRGGTSEPPKQEVVPTAPPPKAPAIPTKVEPKAPPKAAPMVPPAAAAPAASPASATVLFAVSPPLSDVKLTASRGRIEWLGPGKWRLTDSNPTSEPIRVTAGASGFVGASLEVSPKSGATLESSLTLVADVRPLYELLPDAPIGLGVNVGAASALLRQFEAGEKELDQNVKIREFLQSIGLKSFSDFESFVMVFPGTLESINQRVMFSKAPLSGFVLATTTRTPMKLGAWESDARLGVRCMRSDQFAMIQVNDRQIIVVAGDDALFASAANAVRTPRPGPASGVLKAARDSGSEVLWLDASPTEADREFMSKRFTDARGYTNARIVVSNSIDLDGVDVSAKLKLTSAAEADRQSVTFKSMWQILFGPGGAIDKSIDTAKADEDVKRAMKNFRENARYSVVQDVFHFGFTANRRLLKHLREEAAKTSLTKPTAPLK